MGLLFFYRITQGGVASLLTLGCGAGFVIGASTTKNAAGNVIKGPLGVGAYNTGGQTVTAGGFYVFNDTDTFQRFGNTIEFGTNTTVGIQFRGPSTDLRPIVNGVTTPNKATTLILDADTLTLRADAPSIILTTQANAAQAPGVLRIESKILDASVESSIAKTGETTLELANAGNEISGGINVQSGTVRITTDGDLTLDAVSQTAFGKGVLLAQTAAGTGTAGTFEIAAAEDATVTVNGKNKITLNDSGALKISGTNVTTRLADGGSLASTDALGQEGSLIAEKIVASNFDLGVKIAAGDNGSLSLQNANGGAGFKLALNNLVTGVKNLALADGAKLVLNKTTQNLSTAKITVTGAATIDVDSSGFVPYEPFILTLGTISVDNPVTNAGGDGLLTFANWEGNIINGLGSTRIITTMAAGTVIEGVQLGTNTSTYAIVYRNTANQNVLIPFDSIYVWKNGDTAPARWDSTNWMMEDGTPITSGYADKAAALVIFDTDRADATFADTITIAGDSPILGTLIFRGDAKKDLTIEGGSHYIELNSGSAGSQTATTITQAGVSNITFNTELREAHTGQAGGTSSGMLNIRQNGDGALTFNHKITGYEMGVSVTGTGAGAVVFNGANSISGGMILDLDNVLIGTDHLLGTTDTLSVLTVKSGTIRATDGTAANADADRALGNRYDIAGDFTLAGTGKLAITQHGGVNTDATITVADAAGELVLGSAGMKLGVIAGDNVTGFTNTLTLDGAGKATLAADIQAGGGALVLHNAQTTLSGANAHTGGTTIGDGTTATAAVVTNAAGLGTGAATVAAQSTLDFTSAITSGKNTAAITNDGAVTLASTGATYSGAITNNATLAVTGAGNTLAGAVTNAGTVTVGAATTLASTGAIANNGTLNLDAVLTTTGVTAPVTGTGTLNVNTGAAGQTLSGVTNGTVNIAAANVTLSGTNSAATLWDIKSTGAATATTLTALGGDRINLDGTLAIKPATPDALDFTAQLSGDGTLAIDLGATANTLAFSNANNAAASTFTGTVHLQKGTLNFDATTADMLGGTTTKIGNGTAGSAVANIAVTNTEKLTALTLDGATLNVTTEGATLVAKDITIGTGGLSFDAPVAQGNLLSSAPDAAKFTATLALADNAVTNNGNITYAGGASETIDVTQNAVATAKATYTNAVALTHDAQNGIFLNQTLTALDIVAGQTLTLAPADMGGRYLTVALGETGASGSLKVAAGTNTLTLTQTNTYTGATEVASGTLELQKENGIAASAAVTIAESATLTAATAQKFANISGSGAINITAALTVNNTADTTFSGTIKAHGFTKTGAQNLTLSGGNNTLGAVTVSGTGKLTAADAGALGTGGVTVNAGASLEYADTFHEVSVANAITNYGTTTIASGNSQELGATYTGAITNAGQLAITGSHNEFTGTIDATGLITIAGSWNTFAPVTTTANITVTGDNNMFDAFNTGDASTKIEITQTARNTHFYEKITGAAAFDIAASYVFIDSEENATFTGTWTIRDTGSVSGGRNLSSAAVFGQGAITLDGALDFSGGNFSNALSGSGKLTFWNLVERTKIVITGDTSAFTGTVAVSTGVITLDDTTAENNLATATLQLRSRGIAKMTGDVTLGALDLHGGIVEIEMNGVYPEFNYNAGTVTLTDTASVIKTHGLVVGENGGTADPAPANYMDISTTGNEVLLIAGATDGTKQINLVDGNDNPLTGDTVVTDANGIHATYGLAAIAKTIAGKTDGLYMDYLLKSLTVDSGKTLALDGTAGNGGKTLAAEIIGTGDVTLDGGTLTLAYGNQNFSGTMTVKDGATAKSANANAFGTGAVVLENNATLALSGYDQTLVTFTDTATSAVTLAGSGKSSTLTLTGAANELKGAFALNGGHLVLNGADTVVTTGKLSDGGVSGTKITFGANATVAAANTGLTNKTTVTNADALTLKNIAALGTALITNNGTVTLDNVGGVFQNVTSGSGKIVINAAGKTVAINHANTYSGGTALNAGTLAVGHNNALGASAVTLAANTALDYANAVSLGNAITLSGDAAINVAAGKTAAQTGAITGTANLAKTGAGVLTLTAANTGYTGATTITEGTLVTAANNALGTGGVTNNATLEIADAVTDFANAITNTGGVITVKADNLALGGAIENGAVNFVGGTATVTGANTGVAWNIDGASNATFVEKTALGSGALAIQQNGFAALNATGAVTLDNALTGAGTLAVTLGDTADAFVISAAAGGAFTGVLQLNNATYDLASGNNANALDDAKLELANGSVAKWNAVETIGDLALAGGQIGVGMKSANEAHILTVGVLDVENSAQSTVNLNTAQLPAGAITAGNFLDQDDISGAGGIQIVKAGSVTTEGKQITLLIDGVSSGNNDQTHIVGDGRGNTDIKATYGYETVTTKGEHLAGGAGLYVDYVLKVLETQTDLVLDTTGARDTTLGAKITGVGNVELRANSGTLTLANAANDYTGATTVTSGTVTAAVDNALGATSLLTVNDGAIFNLNGKKQTVGKIDSNGTINFGAGTLKITDGGTITGDGALVGDKGALLHVDPSDLVISGANTGFHGDTLVELGSSVTLDNVLGLGDGAITLTGGATDNTATNGKADTLVLAVTDTAKAGAFANAITGNGTLRIDGMPDAEIKIARANTGFTGVTEVAVGKLTVTDVGGVGTSAIKVGDGSGAGAVFTWKDISGDTAQIENAVTLANDGVLRFENVHGEITTGDDGKNIASPASIQSDISGAGTVAIEKSTLAVFGQNTAAQIKLAESSVTLAAPDALGSANSAVTLDAKSYLALAVNDARLGNVTNNGIIAFTAPDADGGAFKTATVTSLAGSGNLFFNVNFVSLEADHLTVLDSATGQQTVHVNQIGANPTSGDGSVTLIRTDNFVSAADAFKLPTNLAGKEAIDIGSFAYTLRQGDGSAKLPDAQNWYLVGDSLSKSAEAIVAGAAGTGLGFHAEMDTLLKRMGDLRLGQRYGAPGCGHDLQTWVRGYGWENKVSDKVTGTPYKEYYYGADAGMDKTYRLDDGYLTTGLFLGAGRAKRQFNGFGDGHTDSYHGGVYISYMHDAGWYADLVAKANYYETDFETVSAYGDKTTGDYDQWAGGISLEIGKQLLSAKGWFAEPQLQVSYGRIAGIDYTTEGFESIGVDLEKQDTFQVRGGVRVGKNIATTHGTFQPYAKASAVGMWTDGGHVRTDDGLSRRATLDGGRVELGVGVVWQTSESGQIYFDYEYIRAQRFEIPWKLNAGYRMSW